MENKSHALVAGIFVLVLGMAAAAAIWWFAQSGQRNNRYLIETLGSVTGLNAQAQVRYRGIRAGKVEAIAPDPTNPKVIQVLISLDQRYKLTKGSTAQLAYQGLTGAAFVLIDDDGRSSDALVAMDDLPPRIQMKTGSMESLFERAGQLLTQLSVFSAQANRLLDDKSTNDIKQSLENVKLASESLRELPKMVVALREMVSPENIGLLNRTLVHLEKTTGEAAPMTAEVREMVRSVTALSKKLDGLTATVGGELANETLPQAKDVLREAKTTVRQLSRILQRLEGNPQMLILGQEPATPGPGEKGYGTQP